MSKGFALIEVLIASLILSIFAASFVFMISSGIKQVDTSTELSNAMFICKSVMEEIISKPFEDLYLYDGKSFDNGAGKIIIILTGNDVAFIKVINKIEIATLRSRY